MKERNLRRLQSDDKSRDSSPKGSQISQTTGSTLSRSSDSSNDTVIERDVMILNFINLGADGYEHDRQKHISSIYWRRTFPKRVDLVMLLMSQLVEIYKRSLQHDHEEGFWPYRGELFEQLHQVTILYNHSDDSVLGFYYLRDQGDSCSEIILLQAFSIGVGYGRQLVQWLQSRYQELTVRPTESSIGFWVKLGFQSRSSVYCWRRPVAANN